MTLGRLHINEKINARRGTRRKILNLDNKTLQRVIIEATPEAVTQARKFAHHFDGGNAKATAANIHKWLREKITYKRDPDAWQIIKLPSAFLRDGTADCKTYSLFAFSVLHALGYPVAYRLTSYSSDPKPSHIYTYTRTPEGETIILDGTAKNFNWQKTPITHFKDYKSKLMNAKVIAGINENGPYIFGMDDIDETEIDFDNLDNLDDLDSIEGLRDRIKNLGGKIKAKVQNIKGNVQKKLANAKKKLGEAAKKILKPLAVGPRLAFLGLVKLNFRSFATNIAKSSGHERNEIKRIWEGFGGRFSELLRVANQNKNKKRLGGYGEDSINGIGEPVTVATVSAAVAAATPILIAIGKVIKTAAENKKDKQLAVDLDNAMTEAKKLYVDSGGNPELANVVQQFTTKNAVLTEMQRQAPGKPQLTPGAPPVYDGPALSPPSSSGSSDDGGPDLNDFILPVGILAAFLFLTKK